MSKFVRTESLIGKVKLEKLKKSHVMVFGVGGVGGYVVEALARSGVGMISIIDNDIVSESNINRQIIATTKTIGLAKVDVMKERILSINPECEVHTYKQFVLTDNIDDFDFSSVSYVVDAVDTVTAKIAIIEKAKKENVMVISAMGAGNRIDPSQIKVVDINQTKNCPLAKVMRYELRKRDIKNVKCVFSTEEPIISKESHNFDEKDKKVIASIAYMPSIFGLIMASEIIKDIIKNC